VSIADTMTFHSLKLRLRALLAPRRVERELEEEIAFHLERETRQLIAKGLDAAEARARAQAKFGSATVAADLCRDERGTAWVDHLVRDVLYAFRMLRRAPGASLAIITTLALGLGLVTVVFTVLNSLIFSIDDVRNPRELFAITRPPSPAASRASFTRPQYEALLRETNVFAEAYATIWDIGSRVDGRTMNGTLVTGNFFHVLGVSAALGRTLTPADDERFGGQQVIVLSQNGWARQFDRDPGVIGRTVQVNGAPFQIVGVMPEGFRGLAVSPPDYWAPLALVGTIRPGDGGHEDAVDVGIIGRLRPGLSREQALAELVVWDARGVDRTAGARPRAALQLEPRLGTAPVDEAMWLLSPLFFAFGLILLIGCANVANLLLARAVARQREIGIRLATGASRRRVIGQLLTESLLLALISAALGYALSRLLVGVMIDALLNTMPPDLGDIRLAVPPPDWRVAVFMVAAAIASTMLFALLPALQATRVELVRAIRGEVVRDARPSRTRNVLIAVQVTASVLLLIGSAVFLRSAMSATMTDPGIRTADTLTVEVRSEPLRAAMLDAVRREPSVASIAASWPDVLGWRTAFAEGASGKSPIVYKFVSPEYFSVLGIDIVRGRGFTPSERSANAAVAIVSESVARQLWPSGDAVGQLLHLDPDTNTNTITGTSAEKPRAGDPTLLSRSAIVVGIARDVPGFRFFPFKESMVYVPIQAETTSTSLTLRVHGDPELTRRALLDRFAAIDPNMGYVFTLRTFAGMETYFLHLGFWFTLALGALALALTLSGLFSVLSYLVEQRAREIGVRMALGATHRNICLLVLAQMARPVTLGLLIGVALSATLGLALLATPAAAQIGASVHLFDPLAYATSLLFILTACALAGLLPALRAGRIDPVATLRRD
jgi:predicted permease